VTRVLLRTGVWESFLKTFRLELQFIRRCCSKKLSAFLPGHLFVLFAILTPGSELRLRGRQDRLRAPRDRTQLRELVRQRHRLVCSSEEAAAQNQGTTLALTFACKTAVDFPSECYRRTISITETPLCSTSSKARTSLKRFRPLARSCRRLSTSSRTATSSATAPLESFNECSSLRLSSTRYGLYSRPFL
jgi:hypothetical protein